MGRKSRERRRFSSNGAQGPGAEAAGRRCRFRQEPGVEDGNLERMRADVRANLEREVRRRAQARVKDQALKTLLETSTLEIPKALVDMRSSG